MAKSENDDLVRRRPVVDQVRIGRHDNATDALPGDGMAGKRKLLQHISVCNETVLDAGCALRRMRADDIEHLLDLPRGPQSEAQPPSRCLAQIACMRWSLANSPGPLRPSPQPVRLLLRRQDDDRLVDARVGEHQAGDVVLHLGGEGLRYVQGLFEQSGHWLARWMMPLRAPDWMKSRQAASWSRCLLAPSRIVLPIQLYISKWKS